MKAGVSKGQVYSNATKLNSTGRRVESSCVAIDTLTGSWRSELIGDSCSRCECVNNSTSSGVELRRHRYRHFADATQLNLTLSGVESSCVAIDTLTGSWRSELIGDSCSRCERVDNSTSSCVGVAIDTSPMQLNSTSSGVELCRYKRALRSTDPIYPSPSPIILRWY